MAIFHTASALRQFRLIVGGGSGGGGVAAEGDTCGEK